MYSTQKIPLKAIKTSPKPKFELGLISRDLVVNRMPDLPLAVDLDYAFMTHTQKADTLKLENAYRFRKVSRNQKAKNEELAALYQQKVKKTKEYQKLVQEKEKEDLLER